jgi:arsenate reductase
MTRIKILFLCTGNSCRSQMAQGWARKLKSEEIEAESAGVIKHGVNPRAVRAMREADVDISDQRSKSLDDLESLDFDYVVTLCGHAHESCPNFPREATVIHRGFDDPPTLAMGAGSEEEAMDPFRRVRDEIKEFVRGMPGNLPEKNDEPDLSVKL